jgi:acyl transferase domain-containing protein
MDPKNALHLIQTMGSLGAKGYGGQVIYPITGDDWKPDPAREAKAHAVISGELYLSIKLGGYVVYGGTDAAIDGVMKALPPEQSRYPMKLVNHSAFHTPVMNPVSAKAQEILGLELFQSPAVPLVSGRGEIYQPWGTDAEELRSYTLGYQVVAPYDFSKAIEVALKEFAPDRLIVLGPGTTLGGAIGQCLVQHRWRGITSKADFLAAQEKDPFLLAMGLAGQRSFVAT